MLTFSLPIGKYCAQFHSLLGNGTIKSSIESIYDYIAQKSPFYSLDRYSQQLYSSKYSLILTFYSLDFQTPEQTELPLLTTKTSVLSNNSIFPAIPRKFSITHPIFSNLIQDLQMKFELSANEGYKMLELYYLTFRLILACYQHQKIGRDFVQSGYILELLGKYLPFLTESQKSRFYYWELLKFDINNFISNWYTFESFELLLLKFSD